MGLRKVILKALKPFSEISEKELQDDFAQTEEEIVRDPYMQDVWVANCVDIISRNVGRADFEIKVNGVKTSDGFAARLFDEPNPYMSRFELWQRTAAWWSLEGEAFWYFGNDYASGVPKELHVLNPRKIQAVMNSGEITKWVYEGNREKFIILPSEIIHFKNWNPYNHYRGLSPLLCMKDEIGEDILASRQYRKLLKEGGIPKGLLKTDQILTEADAELLEKKWESKYGSGVKNKIAVLGKGTEYQQLTFSPDVLKLYDMKKWNLYTILARYGIPPRVANIQDAKSSLSGTDTNSQHTAFWNYTLIPLLQQFSQIVEVQFFRRFHLKERGSFNLDGIPELQESKDARSKRDIAEINAGLKTINDVLKERGQETKKWGDYWYRKSNLIKEG